MLKRESEAEEDDYIFVELASAPFIHVASIHVSWISYSTSCALSFPLGGSSTEFRCCKVLVL